MVLITSLRLAPIAVRFRLLQSATHVACQFLVFVGSDRGALPRWLRPNGPRDRKYLGDDEQSPPAASRGSCQGEETYIFADERPGK